MVILAHEPELAVLLIERPHTLHHHPGQLALPGGSFDPAVDQSLWHTAQRETQEEVGIAIHEADRLGYLDPVYIPVTGYTIAPIVAEIRERPIVYPQVSEVADYAWVPLAELRRVRRVGRVGLYIMPEFPLEFGRLWGATARVMDSLMEHLGEGQDDGHSPTHRPAGI